uniref:Uncharacterized protein n=1 Tax=Arundo donax TaxID=35708 RepID=A0A0A9B9R5_ARUDO
MAAARSRGRRRMVRDRGWSPPCAWRS